MSWHESVISCIEGYVPAFPKRRRARRSFIDDVLRDISTEASFRSVSFSVRDAVIQANGVLAKNTRGAIAPLDQAALWIAYPTGERPQLRQSPWLTNLNCRWIRDRQLMLDDAGRFEPVEFGIFRFLESIANASVGSITYKLRQPSFAVLECKNEQEQQGWSFCIQSWPEPYSGNGCTSEEAQKDCFNKIHVAFQSLVTLRPFRMNAEQLEAWTFLESVIDVEDYWQQIPLRVWETGTISSTKSSGFEVNWRDGNLTEVVKFEQATPEFARLTRGDWFDALVERNPSSRELKQVLDIRRIEPHPIMSEAEVSKWLEGLPVGQPLPKSTKTLADL
jgi:hypothetical protein